MVLPSQMARWGSLLVGCQVLLALLPVLATWDNVTERARLLWKGGDVRLCSIAPAILAVPFGIDSSVACTP